MPSLDFKGKQLVCAHHLSVPARTHKPDSEKSFPPKGNKPSLNYNVDNRTRVQSQPRRINMKRFFTFIMSALIVLLFTTSALAEGPKAKIKREIGQEVGKLYSNSRSQ